MDITPKDAKETKVLNIGQRITVALGIVIAAAGTLLASVGGLDWITANLPLLGTGLGSFFTGAITVYVAVRRMRLDKIAKGAGLVALLLAGCTLLTACAITYNSTPIMSDSNGETVVSDAINIKIGFGTKEATSIGAYKLSADGGLSIDNLDSKNDSSAVLIQGLSLGAQLTERYLKANGIPVGTVASIDSAVASGTDTAPAATSAAVSDAQTVYSADGYGGAPGPAGEGIYGRPSCARCRAYRAAHPEVALVNIDDAANRADMWAALRLRGYTGTSAALPVAVTAAAYTLSAK